MGLAEVFSYVTSSSFISMLEWEHARTGAFPEASPEGLFFDVNVMASRKMYEVSMFWEGRP